MILTLIVVGYALLAVGTARSLHGRLYAEYVEFHREQFGWSMAKCQEKAPDDATLFFGTVLGGLLWPFVWAWCLVLKPIGTVIGPLLIKWWRVPRERALRKAGLS